MSKLELILLGQFECLLPSGTRISLSMRKAEVLLAYLALTPGLRHPRKRLINLLWSDRGEEQARNSLRQCLSAIKKSLGEVADLVLLVDRSTVSLVAELIDIDVHEFERLAAEGDFESLTTAADLYQGEFLEGISIRDASCQEWLDSERSRFKRQFIEILLNLAETQLVSHDFNHAIKSAERLVKQDPLGETGWRLLMRAYFDSGDRSHALQAFKRCQQALRDELDVDPETATIELRDQIAGGKANPEPAPAPIASKPPVASTVSTDHSIAVLPFDNLSGDPEQEYFSDGITASVILGLGLFKGLTVKSQNSSFAYKNRGESSEQIADALSVSYLVEGSIRKSAHKVRISVQLIESASGNQIWGKQYDAELEDILELEQELSRSIAATISGRIGHTLQQSAARKPAKDLQSYDYLMRGLYHLGKFSANDLEIATEEFGKCLEIDPENATAHFNLGMVHYVEILEGWTRDRQKSEKLAARHLETALQLEPDNALAHAYMADYLNSIGEFGQSEFHADKAIELNPTAAEGYFAKADLLRFTRRIEQAIPYADKSLQLDPHSVGAGWAAGGVYQAAGQYDKAIKTFRSISHPPASIHAQVAACFIGLESPEEARKEMKRYQQLARQQMSDYPESEEAWRLLWRDYSSMQYDEDFDDLFDLLKQAGLCEDLV